MNVQSSKSLTLFCQLAQKYGETYIPKQTFRFNLGIVEHYLFHILLSSIMLKSYFDFLRK